MLRGESVIDWHRLDVSTPEEARELIQAQELSPDDARDRERMEQLKADAISYLRRHFEFTYEGARAALHNGRCNHGR